MTGPWVEANVLHVQQQRVVERSQRTSKFTIWDVGFGAAANVLAAICALRNSVTPIEIHSFDINTDAIEFALLHAESLVYPVPYQSLLRRLLNEKYCEVSEKVTWQLHLGDFREQIQDNCLPAPHSVFYDPYSPSRNPEMWSLDHFLNLRKRMDTQVPCLLTNYTRSTAVRVTFLMAGFFVGAGCEIGEKAETTLVSNRLELLPRPLGRDWLKRIRNSTNSAPMRSLNYSKGVMSEEDYSFLEKLPQFQL